MEATPTRIVKPNFPYLLYVEAGCIFMLANFVFLQQVFKSTNNRLQFLAFLGVNAFTSC